MDAHRPKRSSNHLETRNGTTPHGNVVTKNRKIEFNDFEIREKIKDPQDAMNVENVVKMMMCITYQQHNCINYEIQTSEDHYYVEAAYPTTAEFTISALSAIEQVNIALVEKVAVGYGELEKQKNGSKSIVPVLIVRVKIRRTDSEFPLTVETVEYVQRRISGVNHRRIRNVEDVKEELSQIDDNSNGKKPWKFFSFS